MNRRSWAERLFSSEGNLLFYHVLIFIAFVAMWKSLTTFNITSVVTTTGFASDDYTAWGPGAVGMFLVLMFVGGCSGSTSGAIKIYRHQILLILVRAHVKRLFSPNRVIPLRYNGKALPADVPCGHTYVWWHSDSIPP